MDGPQKPEYFVSEDTLVTDVVAIFWLSVESRNKRDVGIRTLTDEIGALLTQERPTSLVRGFSCGGNHRISVPSTENVAGEYTRYSLR